MSGDDRFRERARALGFDAAVREFPEGTKTAEDAARAIGCTVAQIIKSLVFVADDRPIVALTSGINRADTKRLARALEATSLRQAKADEVREATGYAIGGVPPFGHDRSLPVVIDRDLLDHDEVWGAAGTPRSVFPIAPAQLQSITGALVCDFRSEPSSPA